MLPTRISCFCANIRFNYYLKLKCPLWLVVRRIWTSITAPAEYCLATIPCPYFPVFSFGWGCGASYLSPQTPHFPPNVDQCTCKSKQLIALDFMSIQTYSCSSTIILIIVIICWSCGVETPQWTAIWRLQHHAMPQNFLHKKWGNQQTNSYSKHFFKLVQRLCDEIYTIK